MADDGDRDLITTSTVAEILHMSTRGVQRAVNTGQIPIVGTVGPHRQHLFDRQVVERIAKEQHTD